MTIRMGFILCCLVVSTVSTIASVVTMLLTHTQKIQSLPGGIAASLLIGLWLFAATLAYVIAQSIRRRLYDIEEASVLIASGRLHHRVLRTQDADEIGKLARQFNRMGEQLEANVASLQALAEENWRLAGEAERVATLDERQRLARELHDSVSQQLFAIHMLAAAAVRQNEQGLPALESTLVQLGDLAMAAQREMRGLLLQLKPVELEGKSLHAALEQFLFAVADRHGVEVKYEPFLTQELSESVEHELFRIVQEAVANALKHAQASVIQVRFETTDYAVRMQILDDGIGMGDVNIRGNLTHTTGDGYGLQAMHERAAALGGSCHVYARSQGTGVEVQIPIVSIEEDVESHDSSRTH